MVAGYITKLSDPAEELKRVSILSLEHVKPRVVADP
jgi:hypothetical protein